MRRFLSFAMAAVLLMASCAKEYDSLSASGETVDVTFSANLPIEVSRTVGDGSQANVLNYAIYDTAGNLFADYPYDDDVTVSGNKATVKLELVKGQSYNVAFWAQNENAPYAFNRAAGTVTVSYDNELSNDETLDAFYKLEPITVSGPAVKDVVLKRPFAQINLGATKADVEAAKKLGVEIDKSMVTLTNVMTELNLLSGKASRPTTATVDVTFNYNDLPGNDLTVNEVPYAYIAANYILANTESDVTELTFAVKDGDKVVNTVNVPSVNYQRNYRTNILGRLLTSSVDFNIVIEGDTDGDIGQSWDGESIAEPGVNAEGDLVVSNAEQLAWVARAVNGTLPATRAGEAPAADSFKNQTIVLASDIALDGKEWTPIGNGSKHFMGTFDGQGHTISNFKITERRDDRAALFGTVSGTISFRNVTIKNADVRCPDYSDDFYGSALIGTAYGNVTIEYVNVEDSYISGNNKVGALIAHDGVMSSLNINKCNVSGTTFEALNAEDGGSVGGLVGYFQGVAKSDKNAAPYGSHIIANSTVKDCTFNVVNSTNTGKRANAQLIGGIDSKAGQELYINNCVVENNTWNEKFYAGGVEVTSGTYESAYGILIGGERDDDPKGKVFIDGVEVVMLTPIEGAEGVALDREGNYVITAEEGMASISALIAADENNFAGKTIKLNTNVDLAGVKTMGDSFAPLGSTGERDGRNRLICEPFKGTFDGQGHTIANIYQSGWDMGYDYDNYGSIGLFSELEGATVKNVVLEGFNCRVERGDISFIAGSATGTCVFENIEIKSGTIGTFDNGNGGIIGWSGAGNYTFKNIKLGADVVIAGMWGSFDQSCGGIVGQAEPGTTYNFENVEINCRLDVYNDVTASWQYYLYRMCGMIIGRCQETTTIDGVNYPDLDKYNMTFNNVVVNYGDWMNYHYCHGPYGMKGNAGRVEPGFAYDGLDINAENHDDTCTEHMQWIPFDQLIGGDQIGVRGLREVDGVTVNYPESYYEELQKQQ